MSYPYCIVDKFTSFWGAILGGKLNLPRLFNLFFEYIPFTGILLNVLIEILIKIFRNPILFSTNLRKRVCQQRNKMILYEHSHQFLNEILRKRENSKNNYCLDRKIRDFLIQGDLFFQYKFCFFFLSICDGKGFLFFNFDFVFCFTFLIHKELENNSFFIVRSQNGFLNYKQWKPWSIMIVL